MVAGVEDGAVAGAVSVAGVLELTGEERAARRGLPPGVPVATDAGGARLEVAGEGGDERVFAVDALVEGDGAGGQG